MPEAWAACAGFSDLSVQSFVMSWDDIRMSGHLQSIYSVNKNRFSFCTKDIKEKMDAGYSPFHIRLFQTKFHLVKRGFPSASAKKGLELSH